MRNFRYCVEPDNNQFIVRRLVKNGNTFVADRTRKPVTVTNHELLIADLSALFEFEEIEE